MGCLHDPLGPPENVIGVTLFGRKRRPSSGTRRIRTEDVTVTQGCPRPTPLHTTAACHGSRADIARLRPNSSLQDRDIISLHRYV